MCSSKRWVLSIAAIGLAVTFVAAGYAAKKPKGGNFVWTHPDYAKLDVQSIAMLPVTSYDNNLEAEKHVEAGLGAALRASNYRWVSGSSSRDRLRAQGGDSLLSLVRTNVTNQVRIDSLAAPALCQRLGVDALLSIRIDLWERFEPEWDQAGKPTTSVQIRAALVDSLGRLLWNAAGTETGEGPYHDPSAPAIGVSGSGPGGPRPITAQGGAPAFDEVLTKLFARWAPQFPSRPVTGAPAN
jgi:hypothetical protein